MEQREDFVIQAVEAGDLPAILALQRLAYQSQAELLNNPDIPPLRETLDEIIEQFSQGVTILKATDGEGAIVGSVRARRVGDDAHVGKLMVHPHRQGHGLGTRLLRAIEEACPATRYELFTSTESLRNIALYERVGYSRLREEEKEPGLVMVHLQKVRRVPMTRWEPSSP